MDVLTGIHVAVMRVCLIVEFSRNNVTQFDLHALHKVASFFRCDTDNFRFSLPSTSDGQADERRTTDFGNF